jgi:aspartyl protease family protein
MPSPWGRGPSYWIWLVIIAGGLTAFVMWLAADRGGMPGDPATGSRIVQGIVLVAVIAAGLVHGRRIGFKGAIGALSAWVAIGAVLILGYSFRFEFEGAWRRIKGEVVPDAAVTTAGRSIEVRRADDGHFYIRARVNGTSVRFLVDTGASTTVLGPRDAARIGIDVRRLAFTQRFSTANGTVRGAPIRLKTLEIGPARFEGVRASVNEAPLGAPLLGISTLSLFKGWKVENDRMTLTY